HVIWRTGIGRGDRVAQTTGAGGVASTISIRVGCCRNDERRINVARLALERANVCAVATSNRGTADGARKSALIRCGPAEVLAFIDRRAAGLQNVRRSRATIVGERP